MHVCIISQEMKSLYKDYKYDAGCVMIFTCMHVFGLEFFLGDVAVGSFAILLPLFLRLTHFRVTGCIVSDSGLCTGTFFGGVPWVTRVT